MTDNVTLPGTGTVVASDDIGGGVQAQLVKIADGTSGSSTPVPGSSYGLRVEPLRRLKVALGTITGTGATYVSGDQVGDPLELTNVLRENPNVAGQYTGTIRGLRVVDPGGVLVNPVVWLCAIDPSALDAGDGNALNPAFAAAPAFRPCQMVNTGSVSNFKVWEFQGPDSASVISSVDTSLWVIITTYGAGSAYSSDTPAVAALIEQD